MVEVEDGDDDHDRFQRGKKSGIPSPAEAHVQNGPEGHAEEIWRESSGRHEGDSRLRYMAGGQELRNGEIHYA